MDSENYLEELHSYELKILDEVVRICDKHNLQYCIIAGTLLGAVRHGGFIPWDDDLDIVMPRKDLDRFTRLSKTELGEEYYLQTTKTDPQWYRPFAKVRLNNTLFLENGNKGINNGFHNGVFIDIFPLDNAKKEKGIQQYQKKTMMKLTTIMQYKLGIVCGSPVKMFFASVLSFSLLQRLQRRVMTLASNRSTYFVNLSSQYSVEKQTMRKEVYFPSSTISFSGKMYAAPNDVFYYLERIYGKNYMQLPPLEKRRTHKPLDICFNLKERESTRERETKNGTEN